MRREIEEKKNNITPIPPSHLHHHSTNTNYNTPSIPLTPTTTTPTTTNSYHLFQDDGLIHRHIPSLRVEAESRRSPADADGGELEKIPAQHQLHASERLRTPSQPGFHGGGGRGKKRGGGGGKSDKCICLRSVPAGEGKQGISFVVVIPSRW